MWQSSSFRGAARAIANLGRPFSRSTKLNAKLDAMPDAMPDARPEARSALYEAPDGFRGTYETVLAYEHKMGSPEDVEEQRDVKTSSVLADGIPWPVADNAAEETMSSKGENDDVEAHGETAAVAEVDRSFFQSPLVKDFKRKFALALAIARFPSI